MRQCFSTNHEINLKINFTWEAVDLYFNKNAFVLKITKTVNILENKNKNLTLLKLKTKFF